MKSIMTSCGPLLPQHTANDLRKKPVERIRYHDSGHPVQVPLEEQTVIATPAGHLPAELVSFHANGKVNRVFPLNGRLSGYWSQEDESDLARPLTVFSPLGPLTARILSVSFRDDGSLRSITLWPGETLDVQTQMGVFKARIGISFDARGRLQSFEPARPIAVRTPAGEMMAYDPDAVGINGDANSLRFDADGRVCALTTTLSSLKVVLPEGEVRTFSPTVRESLCGDTELEPEPLRLEFAPEYIGIRQTSLARPTLIPTVQHLFMTAPYVPQFTMSPGLSSCEHALA